MFCYPKAAVERAMKVQEVILRAMAKKITWWQAAEIIGCTDRTVCRWRFEQAGYEGLLDGRRRQPSPADAGSRHGLAHPGANHHAKPVREGYGDELCAMRASGRVSRRSVRWPAPSLLPTSVGPRSAIRTTSLEP